MYLYLQAILSETPTIEVHFVGLQSLTEADQLLHNVSATLWFVHQWKGTTIGPPLTRYYLGGEPFSAHLLECIRKEFLNSVTAAL